MSLRQVVLDTETTGMNGSDPIHQGHGVIEIGAVELINRCPKRTFQCYLKPIFPISESAFKVHGITQSFLKDKPEFQEIIPDFLAFIEGSELIIHNAKFDVAFLNAELARARYIHPRFPGAFCTITQLCGITDTLILARKKFPGRSNSLDALCKRFQIDLTQRSLHGALLDAHLLVKVFLALTEGQGVLGLECLSGSIDQIGLTLTSAQNHKLDTHPLESCHPHPVIIKASAAERQAHQLMLEAMATMGTLPIWNGVYHLAGPLSNSALQTEGASATTG